MFFSLLAGLGIGLLGSFHCIGMCGPIALSLPIYGKSFVEKLLLIVLYNIGRATAYASLGILFGFIGNQFFLFGYQQAFSIGIGVLLLLSVLGKRYNVFSMPILQQFTTRLKHKLSILLQSSKNQYSYFLIGFLNGFLPCGLVYMAIGAAMATGNVLYGGVLMFMFGLGTFPLMISIMLFGKLLPIKLRHTMHRFVPYMVALTAIIIILRGLDLGIPYLSPQLQQTSSKMIQVRCHK